jgi:hypothetical protein
MPSLGVSLGGDRRSRCMERNSTPHLTTTLPSQDVYVDFHLFVAWSSHSSRCDWLLYTESIVPLPELRARRFMPCVTL